MRPMFRAPALYPVAAYKTYTLLAPPDTSARIACELVKCRAYQFGWKTVIDETTVLGLKQAAYIRTKSGRTFKEQRSGELTVFVFESKQRCFADHRTRPEIYLVRDGDYRGNPTRRRRRHSRPIDWVEDFAEHQTRLVEQQKRG